MQTKLCSKCKEVKPIEDFYRKKRHKDGYNSHCKECINKQNIEYCRNHIEELEKYRKIYYKDNLERTKKNTKKWKKANPEKYREQQKKYYKNHIEYFKEYSKDNVEKINKLRRKRRKNNPEKTRKIDKIRYKIRSRNSTYRLSHIISGSINHSLKSKKNGLHWEDLVNFTLKELMAHLKKQFKPGMTFNNHGKWHIDHKIPKSLFKFESYKDPEFKECWALENLQPLWWWENLRKGSKIY